MDDDPQTLRFVRDALTVAGYSALVTGNPLEVPRLIQEKQPRLVLLDLLLPGTDGIELMQRVPELADLPAIFISGFGRAETIAKALEMGASDYIVKPFSATELVARVRSVLRRRSEPPEPFRLGDLAIHYEDRRVTVAGRPVKLTATEYELLRALSVKAGRVLTYNSNAGSLHPSFEQIAEPVGDPSSPVAVSAAAYSEGLPASRGIIGSVVKIPFMESNSTATPVNLCVIPGATQRTDPVKFDVSDSNISLMNLAS